jgi:hypothetical protein
MYRNGHRSYCVSDKLSSCVCDICDKCVYNKQVIGSIAVSNLTDNLVEFNDLLKQFVDFDQLFYKSIGEFPGMDPDCSIFCSKYLKEAISCC